MIKMTKRYQAAKIFQQHTDEILCELRKTQPGYQVIAEVDIYGHWWGARQEPRATTSSLDQTGYGYAIYLYPEIHKTRVDIHKAIREWLGAWRKELHKTMLEVDKKFATRSGRSMTSILKVAEVVEQHADEILMALLEAPEGSQVIAEVDENGTWRGARVVKADAYSKLAENEKGYAIHFNPETDAGYFDVLSAIDEWLEDWCSEMFSEDM